MLDRYLADLARQLPLAPATRNDILREVRVHLEKTAVWTVGLILGLWALLLSPALLSLARRRQAA